MLEPRKERLLARFRKEIVALLAGGKRYQALILLHRITGLGLEESNAMLDDMTPPGNESPPPEHQNV